ncbi:MAG: hypothetical protein NTY53_21920 [Kiritimatiellaeota bacterium]|nr:hypothetical protein [Kiritimatiellota bacterium]
MVAPKIITRACCVCQRVQINGRWVHTSAQAKDELLLTHSYCPVCYHHALANLRLEMATPRHAALVLAYG